MNSSASPIELENIQSARCEPHCAYPLCGQARAIESNAVTLQGKVLVERLAVRSSGRTQMTGL